MDESAVDEDNGFIVHDSVGGAKLEMELTHFELSDTDEKEVVRSSRVEDTKD